MRHMRMSENVYYETWNAFVECSEKRKAYGTMYRPEDYKLLKEKLLKEVKKLMVICICELQQLEKSNMYDLRKSKEHYAIFEKKQRLENLEILLRVSPEDITTNDFANTYIEKPYHFFLRLLIVVCIAFIGWWICTKV